MKLDLWAILWASNEEVYMFCFFCLNNTCYRLLGSHSIFLNLLVWRQINHNSSNFSASYVFYCILPSLLWLYLSDSFILKSLQPSSEYSLRLNHVTYLLLFSLCTLYPWAISATQLALTEMTPNMYSWFTLSLSLKLQIFISC